MSEYELIFLLYGMTYSIVLLGVGYILGIKYAKHVIITEIDKAIKESTNE